MPDHLLTFELAKDGDELSSVAQDSEASFLHQVTIHGWPK